MELLSKVLQAVLEVSLPILVSSLIVWVIGKARKTFAELKETNADVYYSIEPFVTIAVKAAEQIYRDQQGCGDKKKNYALNLLETFLKSKGISLDLNMIEACIEAEVKKMNDANKTFPTALHE